MMSASHDEANMDVPQAHESVDSRTSVAGRQTTTAELAQMEAAGYGSATTRLVIARLRTADMPVSGLYLPESRKW